MTAAPAPLPPRVPSRPLLAGPCSRAGPVPSVVAGRRLAGLGRLRGSCGVPPRAQRPQRGHAPTAGDAPLPRGHQARMRALSSRGGTGGTSSGRTCHHDELTSRLLRRRRGCDAATSPPPARGRRRSLARHGGSPGAALGLPPWRASVAEGPQARWNGVEGLPEGDARVRTALPLGAAEGVQGRGGAAETAVSSTTAGAVPRSAPATGDAQPRDRCAAARLHVPGRQ